jgi:hypothetical protein
MLAARSAVQATFMHLGEKFTVTSLPSDTYNCAAWAANEDHRYWWPDGQNYWPANVAMNLSAASFAAAFSTLGYVTCPSGKLEKGFEKIALFTRDGVPAHMARQLPSGKWTSKLGESYDIALEDLSGLSGKMGKVSLFMKRKAAA